MSIETVGSQPEKSLDEVEVIENDSSEELNDSEQVGQADLQEILKQANIAESAVPEKIAAVSEEIKEFKSPEEIRGEIKRLQEEYEEKKKAVMQFTHITSTDSGMGALGSFGAGVEGSKKLEAKYPGISGALELLEKAEKKNSTGFKFWKKPELSDKDFSIINRYLKTGSIGRYTNPAREAEDRKILNSFLAENKNSEAVIKTIPQTIWGEHDDKYYEGAIADLNKQLSKMSEAK